MNLGMWNAVRGCPGWTYGLFTRAGYAGYTSLDYYRFDVLGPDGAKITNLCASVYRTTTLARKMGERQLRGYEHVAREAIRELERG